MVWYIITKNMINMMTLMTTCCHGRWTGNHVITKKMIFLMTLMTTCCHGRWTGESGIFRWEFATSTSPWMSSAPPPPYFILSPLVLTGVIVILMLTMKLTKTVVEDICCCPSTACWRWRWLPTLWLGCDSDDIFYDEVSLCLFVCHEKWSLSPLELSAGGANQDAC